MCAPLRTPYDMPTSASHANAYVVASSDHTRPVPNAYRNTTCRNVSSVMNASATTMNASSARSAIFSSRCPADDATTCLVLLGCGERGVDQVRADLVAEPVPHGAHHGLPGREL